MLKNKIIIHSLKYVLMFIDYFPDKRKIQTYSQNQRGRLNYSRLLLDYIPKTCPSPKPYLRAKL